ncbi:hypothetical protein AAKU55_003764 [Oxalobacteraceae bacterium GrIS 1.11]
MKRKWEVDEVTVVEANFGVFGQKIVTVNGYEVYKQRRQRVKGEIELTLPDGRTALITSRQPITGYAIVELRVNGRLMIASGKEAVKCCACGSIVKPYDQFCTKCGVTMSKAKDYTHFEYIKSATTTIWTLAALYLISGVVMFFMAKFELAETFVKLQGMSPEALVSMNDGNSYTVEALSKKLMWQTWGVLIVSAILASVMGVLARWSKRAPLAAILIATAIFVVVNVANAIADPKTLGQGVVVKVFVVFFLLKGIKAALAHRTVNA